MAQKSNSRRSTTNKLSSSSSVILCAEAVWYTTYLLPMVSNPQEYVRALSAEVNPSELSAKGIELIIIGCGDPVLIKDYVATTAAKYPIYADPSRSLYKLFGLVRSLSWGNKKPNYMSFGLVGAIMKGISAGLKAGSNAFKSGDKKQNGGE